MLGVVSSTATVAQLHLLAKLAQAAGQGRARREFLRATGRHSGTPRFELTTAEAVALADCATQAPYSCAPSIRGLVVDLADRARDVHAQNAARPRPGNQLRARPVGTCPHCDGTVQWAPNTAHAICPCGRTRIPAEVIEAGRRRA